MGMKVSPRLAKKVVLSWPANMTDFIHLSSSALCTIVHWGTIQYSETLMMELMAAAYWMPAFAEHDNRGIKEPVAFFRDNVGIHFSGERLHASAAKASRAINCDSAHTPRTHQRARIVEQALGLGRQRRIIGVADRDQHVADEAVAADAFDRRLANRRGTRHRPAHQLRKRRRTQFRARGEFCFAACCANLFTADARQSSQP